MTRKNFTPAIKSYLLTAIENEDHGLENPSEQELIQHGKDRFYSEYLFMVERVGVQNAVREWLLGLALNVEYTYYEIEQVLTSWGVIDGTETENKLQKELDLYWTRLSCNLVKMFNSVKEGS